MDKLNLKISLVLLTCSWALGSYGQSVGATKSGLKPNLSTIQIRDLNVKGTLDADVVNKLKSVMGGVNGGGGDQVGLQFQAAMNTALSKLASSNGKVFSKIDSELQKSRNEMRVVVVDDALDVQLQGLIQTSVAVNIPSLNLILVNRVRWNAIREVELREGIALHEGLSLAGLEQTGYYPYSANYIIGQGIAKVKFEKALEVNRLKQMSTENPKLSRIEILKNFFDEAMEDISIGDIGTDPISNTPEKKCVIVYFRDEVMDLQLTRFAFVLKAGSAAIAGAGPLFPEIAAVPAVTAPGIKLKANLTFDYSNTLNLSNKLKTVDRHEVMVSDKSSQFTSIGTYTDEVRFRKNNGLIVLRWTLIADSGSLLNSAYAYCY